MRFVEYDTMIPAASEWPTREQLVVLFKDRRMDDLQRLAMVRVWMLGPGPHHLEGWSFADVFGSNRSAKERTIGNLVRRGYLVWVDIDASSNECAVEAIWPPKPCPRGKVPNGRYIPWRLRDQVFERDGMKCVLCGGDERLSLDHITPYEDGGSSTYENLRVLCTPCNLRREHEKRRKQLRIRKRVFFTRR